MAKPHLGSSLDHYKRHLKQELEKGENPLITLIKKTDINDRQFILEEKNNCFFFFLTSLKSKRKKDTNKGGNSFGSPMHVYLRIFLACVPTQLVKAFGIKRLNIYCLVQTVWPLQRQRSAPGVGR